MNLNLADDICRRAGWELTCNGIEYLFKDGNDVITLRCWEGRPLSKEARYAIIAAEQKQSNWSARAVKSIIVNGRRVSASWIDVDDETADLLGLGRARKK